MVKQYGVELISIPVDNGSTRINVKLKSGKETEINGKGPALTKEDLNKLKDMLYTLLTKEDFLILSGNVPSSLGNNVYKELIEIANKAGAKCVVDAEGELLTQTLSLKPFLIKPNKAELSMIFNKDINRKEDVIYYAKKLQEIGAENVLVSLGEEGAILVTLEGNTYFHSAPKGIVKNSVGAGDSMVAGFLCSLDDTHDYYYSLLNGIVAGSATAFSGTLTDKEKQRALLKELIIA